MTSSTTSNTTRSPIDKLVNLTVERAYLCVILCMPHKLDDCYLTAADFHDECHAAVFRAMQELHASHAEVDLLGLADRLKRSGLLHVEWDPYLFDLMAAESNISSEPEYQRILRDLARRRQMVQEAS